MMDPLDAANIAQGAAVARSAAELAAIVDPSHAPAFILLDQLIAAGMNNLERAQQVSAMLAIAHQERRALTADDWAKIASADAAAMAALRKPV